MCELHKIGIFRGVSVAIYTSKSMVSLTQQKKKICVTGALFIIVNIVHSFIKEFQERKKQIMVTIET